MSEKAHDEIPVRRTLRLTEWNKLKLFEDASLNGDDRDSLARVEAKHTNAITVIETLQGLRIGTQQWVGVIATPNFTIHIHPKFENGYLDLLRLISYVYGFGGLSIMSEHEQMQEGSDNLLDLIMLLFIRSTQYVVRRGIIRDYLEREAELSVLRGSLDFHQQYRKRFGALDKLHCRYDHYTPLIPENLLVYAGLELCRRLRPPAVAQGEHNRVHAIFSELAEGERPPHDIANENIIYHRQNRHYRDAHEYARMLLRGIGILDIYTRDTLRSHSFLLDMNRLFQSFIERFLRQLFAGTGIDVRTQDHRSMHIIWENSDKNGKPIRPDIVLRDTADPNLVLVADAKYKRLDTVDVSSADIYQMFLYSYAYDREVRRACLFYPAETDAFHYRSLTIRGADGLTGARIWLIGMPVSKILENVTDLGGDAAILEFRGRLMAILQSNKTIPSIS